MKKLIIVLALAALVAGGVFAQRVGDTVRLQGQTQDYTVQSVSGDTITLKKVNLSLDGVWKRSEGLSQEITVSGSSGTLTSYTNPSDREQDALNKGYLKIGGEFWQNLRSTGNLTWSGQAKGITFNRSNPNVAVGTGWGNFTLTMSANGQTLTLTMTSAWTETFTLTRQ